MTASWLAYKASKRTADKDQAAAVFEGYADLLKQHRDEIGRLTTAMANQRALLETELDRMTARLKAAAFVRRVQNPVPPSTEGGGVMAPRPVRCSKCGGIPYRTPRICTRRSASRLNGAALDFFLDPSNRDKALGAMGMGVAQCTCDYYGLRQAKYHDDDCPWSLSPKYVFVPDPTSPKEQ